MDQNHFKTCMIFRIMLKENLMILKSPLDTQRKSGLF